MKPKKWTEVYPYGTKEGEEEAAFFKSLARNPNYKNRSLGAIVKETKLKQERVVEIIDKYSNKIDPPLIYKTPGGNFAYWERDPSAMETSKEQSMSTIDKNARAGIIMNDAVYTVTTTDSGCTKPKAIITHDGSLTTRDSSVFQQFDLVNGTIIDSSVISNKNNRLYFSYSFNDNVLNKNGRYYKK